MKKLTAISLAALLCLGLFALPAVAAAAKDPHAPVVSFIPKARHDIRSDWEFCLAVSAKSPDEGGKITYQWCQATARDKKGSLLYSAIPGETGEKYIKYARLDKFTALEASTWYKCLITNTYKEGGKTKSVSCVTPDLEVHAFLGFVDSFKHWMANPVTSSLPGSVLTAAKGFWAMFTQMFA